MELGPDSALGSPMHSMSYFASPTPLASAVSSLILLFSLALTYALVSALTRRPKGKATGDTALGRLSLRLRSIDRDIIHGVAYVTGTRYQRRSVRILVLLALFLALTAAAVFSPWPWCFVPILVGVLAILAVFRHWTRDEDEAADDVPRDKKDLPIDGDLHIEVKVAVAFLFVFAPIAFAQLQEHGYGFKVAPTAGPFTFVLFILIETVKAGAIVDYYDLWADKLGFERFSGVKEPSTWAKWVIIGYRLSLNLLILVAIKRLLDVARRRAEGRDLRHIEETLRDKTQIELTTRRPSSSSRISHSGVAAMRATFWSGFCNQPSLTSGLSVRWIGHVPPTRWQATRKSGASAAPSTRPSPATESC